ncbi:hypothetical protein [Pseudomonas sp. PA15(2017)]|uniref:hypothetical protein n=1 Tax=Pseudomonas sp. PA15(2017) TaxID=1932111 RepID=UPI001C449638|nr:hypothetical protein [Pseudomonas sp. PA15(2017)]
MTSFNCDDHDVLLGFGDGKCALIVAAMAERGMIITGRLASWDERQPAVRDSAGKRQSTSAARTAAYRQRKKAAQNVTSGDGHSDAPPVTGDKSDAGDAPEKIRVDKSNNPPFPPAGGKAPAKPKPKAKAPAASAEKSAKAKPKRPLPLPFLMTPEMLAWAAEKAPAVTLDRETEQFIDYWTGTGKPMADWQATWRRWMRTAQGDLEKRGLAKPADGGAVDDTKWIHEDDGL